MDPLPQSLSWLYGTIPPTEVKAILIFPGEGDRP